MASSLSHGASVLTEPAGASSAAPMVKMYVVKSGSDWTFSTTGPEKAVFKDVQNDGNYRLIDLTPVYLVSSGSDYTISTTGPATAILVASGSDLAFSTNLALTPAADLYYDTGGDLYVVVRSHPRRDAVRIGGSTIAIY